MFLIYWSRTICDYLMIIGVIRCQDITSKNHLNISAMMLVVNLTRVHMHIDLRVRDNIQCESVAHLTIQSVPRSY